MGITLVVANAVALGGRPFNLAPRAPRVRIAGVASLLLEGVFDSADRVLNLALKRVGLALGL